MDALTCISDYLRLCGQSHNRKYVAMSVMWFMIGIPRIGAHIRTRMTT